MGLSVTVGMGIEEEFENPECSHPVVKKEKNLFKIVHV